MVPTNTEIRRDALRRPVTWLLILGALAALVGVFFLGDALDPLSPASPNEQFDKAFMICSDTMDQLYPDGKFVKEFQRQLDGDDLCLMEASKVGMSLFARRYLNPAYVQHLLDSAG